MRLLCAAALSLSFGLWVAYGEDKKPADPPASDRAEKLKELKKKFDDENKELIARLQKADNPAEERGIRAEMRELVLLTAGKVLKIAEENPKDEVGFDAALFVVQSAGRVGATGGDVEKAVGLIAEHHVTNAKVKDLLIPAMRMGAAGEKLLKAVAEKNTDKDTKGTALFILGFMAARQADEEEDEKKLKELIAKATDLFEKAAKEAPNAKVGQSKQTIAEYAKSEIEGLKEIVIVKVGDPAPDVASKLLDGKDVKLSDYKGQVVLLDIWATWCGPCRAMIPHERDMVKTYKDKPFVLISVSADDEKETLEKFIAKEPMPWVHWWDNGPKSKVLKKYRVNAFPTLLLIDHKGVVREKWLGNPGNDKLDKAVEELVKEAIKAKG